MPPAVYIHATLPHLYQQVLLYCCGGLFALLGCYLVYRWLLRLCLDANAAERDQALLKGSGGGYHCQQQRQEEEQRDGRFSCRPSGRWMLAGLALYCLGRAGGLIATAARKESNALLFVPPTCAYLLLMTMLIYLWGSYAVKLSQIYRHEQCSSASRGEEGRPSGDARRGDYSSAAAHVPVVALATTRRKYYVALWAIALMATLLVIGFLVASVVADHIDGRGDTDLVGRNAAYDAVIDGQNSTTAPDADPSLLATAFTEVYTIMDCVACVITGVALLLVGYDLRIRGGFLKLGRLRGGEGADSDATCSSDDEYVDGEGEERGRSQQWARRSNGTRSSSGRKDNNGSSDYGDGGDGAGQQSRHTTRPFLTAGSPPPQPGAGAEGIQHPSPSPPYTYQQQHSPPRAAHPSPSSHLNNAMLSLNDTNEKRRAITAGAGAGGGEEGGQYYYSEGEDGDDDYDPLVMTSCSVPSRRSLAFNRAGSVMALSYLNHSTHNHLQQHGSTMHSVRSSHSIGGGAAAPLNYYGTPVGSQRRLPTSGAGYDMGRGGGGGGGGGGGAVMSNGSIFNTSCAAAMGPAMSNTNSTRGSRCGTAPSMMPPIDTTATTEVGLNCNNNGAAAASPQPPQLPRRGVRVGGRRVHNASYKSSTASIGGRESFGSVPPLATPPSSAGNSSRDHAAPTPEDGEGEEEGGSGIAPTQPTPIASTSVDALDHDVAIVVANTTANGGAASRSGSTAPTSEGGGGGSGSADGSANRLVVDRAFLAQYPSQTNYYSYTAAGCAEEDGGGDDIPAPLPTLPLAEREAAIADEARRMTRSSLRNFRSAGVLLAQQAEREAARRKEGTHNGQKGIVAARAPKRSCGQRCVYVCDGLRQLFSQGNAPRRILLSIRLFGVYSVLRAPLSILLIVLGGRYECQPEVSFGFYLLEFASIMLCSAVLVGPPPSSEGQHSGPAVPAGGNQFDHRARGHQQQQQRAVCESSPHSINGGGGGVSGAATPVRALYMPPTMVSINAPPPHTYVSDGSEGCTVQYMHAADAHQDAGCSGQGQQQGAAAGGRRDTPSRRALYNASLAGPQQPLGASSVVVAASGVVRCNGGKVLRPSSNGNGSFAVSRSPASGGRVSAAAAAIALKDGQRVV